MKIIENPTQMASIIFDYLGIKRSKQSEVSTFSVLGPPTCILSTERIFSFVALGFAPLTCPFSPPHSPVSLGTFYPKTDPNRTEISVFSVVRFGFGFCAGELRLQWSTSVLMFTEPNTRNQPNCNRQDSKSQAEASA